MEVLNGQHRWTSTSLRNDTKLTNSDRQMQINAIFISRLIVEKTFDLKTTTFHTISIPDDGDAGLYSSIRGKGLPRLKRGTEGGEHTNQKATPHKGLSRA